MNVPNQDILFFVSIVIAIFLEAAPFLLLGSLISAFLEVYVPEDTVARYAPRTPLKGVGFGLCAGLVLPTCECGVVPIVLRLLSKGMPPSAALTYMLASPVINPIVLLSTYVAFRQSVGMVLARALLVAGTAALTGALLGRMPLGRLLRQPRSAAQKTYARGEKLFAPASGYPGTHDHDAVPDGGSDRARGLSRPVRLILHTGSEFLDMGKFLLLGCFAAAFVKTFAPLHLFFLLEDHRWLAVGAMMLLAVLLSVCSEADAFVAASFAALPLASQLAFVSIGPMVDLKLIAVFLAVFRPRAAFGLMAVPVVCVYIGSMLLGTRFG